MLPFLIPAAMAAAGALASRHGAKKAKKGAAAEATAYGAMAGDAKRRAAAQDTRTADSRNSFMQAAQGARDFDPSNAMATQAGSMMTGLQDQYRQATNVRAGNRNARGLFNSGMGEAKGQRHLNDSISQALAGLSMQGAQMKQGALRDYTSATQNIYGSDQNQGNYLLDAAYGLQGSQIGAQAAGDQADAGMWGDIGGSLLGSALQMGTNSIARRRRPIPAYA